MNFDLGMMSGIGCCIKRTRRCKYVHNIVDVVNKYNTHMISQTFALWWNLTSFKKSVVLTSAQLGFLLAAIQTSFNRMIAPLFPLSSCYGQPITHFQTHINILFVIIETSNNAYCSFLPDINVSFKVFACRILAMYRLPNKYSTAIRGNRRKRRYSTTYRIHLPHLHIKTDPGSSKLPFQVG